MLVVKLTVTDSVNFTEATFETVESDSTGLTDFPVSVGVDGEAVMPWSSPAELLEAAAELGILATTKVGLMELEATTLGY